MRKVNIIGKLVGSLYLGYQIGCMWINIWGLTIGS